MNGEKLLKLLISFLIIIQVLGFVLKNEFLSSNTQLILSVSIIVLYIISTKKVKKYHVIVLLTLFVGELILFCNIDNVVKFQVVGRIVVYILLFYFLYYNHKSFIYNSRDVFTLVLGSLLYTVIFFMVYMILSEPMEEMRLLGFLHLLLLYVLLVVGAMHYINIRSEKSLWFFLAMLNFTFSDYMLLIDKFYLRSYELEVLMLICKPLAMVFLVNYMVTRSLKLKSEEFEGF